MPVITKYATTATDVSGGTGTWTNPNNATGSSSGNYATWTSSTSSSTKSIELDGYAFASDIPANSIINSVQYIIKHYESSTTNLLVPQARAYVNTTAIGSLTNLNRSTSTSNSQTLTLGATPTVDQLRDSGFRVRFTARHATNTNSATQYLDFIGIIIDYTAPLPPNAGADMAVDPWSTVTVTGSDALASWSQVSGPTVNLLGTGYSRTFTAPASTQQQSIVLSYGTDQMTVTVRPARDAVKLSDGSVRPVQLNLPQTIKTVPVDASVRSYLTTTHSSGALDVSSETVRTPPQVSTGDLLVLYSIMDSGTSNTLVVPSGFTELGRIVGSPGAVCAISYKVASTSEPATYTYTQYNASADGVSMMIAVKDWDGNVANLSFTTSEPINTSLLTPSITPKTSRNLLLTSIATDDDVSTRTWGWIPPAQSGAVGYMHNSTGWATGAVSHEVYNSTNPTGNRAWSVNTASTQTTRLTASLAIGSGSATTRTTQFSTDFSAGSGGPLTDTTDNTFTDSTGLSSKYHLFAADLNWSRNVGLFIYTDGSGEYGLDTPQITSQSPYLLYGPTGMIAVAKKHNMILLTPRAPGSGCADGDGVCWYDHSPGSNTTPWQKLEWSNELIRYILTQYNINRRRIVLGGYSSGAQWSTAWFGPKYGSEIMKDGLVVAISYGGQPRVSTVHSARHRTDIPYVWDTGDADTAYSQPTWDDGVQTGRAWYQTAGFTTTDLVLVAGKGHDRYDTTTMIGEFGPIMDREITKHVVPA